MIDISSLHSQDDRLLRIIGRMALVSAKELVPIVGIEQQQIQERLTALRCSGWLISTHRGMLETRQERWYLTPPAVEQLYVTDHVHANPREIAKAGGIERLRAGLPPRSPWNEHFALDHEHMPHIDGAMFSPFVEPAIDAPTPPNVAVDMHEHPPWTATTRGQQLCMRRLATLEMIYRLAPMLFASGKLQLPPNHPATQTDLKMTDFRRRHELWHNDGVNRLVLKFANEGVKAFAGWQGEVNLQDITQIKPDLIVLVADGPSGAGPYCIEYERSAIAPNGVARKLGTYRKSAAVGRPVPVLVVCDTEHAAHNFIEVGRTLPLLATHLAAALAGPLTGNSTVWRQAGEPTDAGGVQADASIRLRC